MKDTKTITAIDIGTSKVFVTIGIVNENRKIEVLGSAYTPSLGMDKGIVKDIEKASGSIKTAIEQAEKTSETKISNVYISLTGDHIKSLNVEGRTSISGANDNMLTEVTREHMEMAKNDACNLVRSRPAYKNTEIIHAIPRSYDIDNEKNILNPVNMCGYQLTAYVHVVLAELAALRNIQRCLELAGCNDYQFVLSQIASARATLNEDERNLGSVLLDIGAGTVDIIVYENSNICYTNVIGLGGNNIKKDISNGFMTSERFAEKLKIEHGNVFPDSVDQEIILEIEGIADRPPENKKAYLLSLIIYHRVKEIMSFAYESVKKNTNMHKLTGGLILTGGTSKFINMSLLAKEEFNMPVRIANPDLSLLSGGVSRLKDPKLACSVGLLYYGYDNLKQIIGKSKGSDNVRSLKNISLFFKKIIEYISDFF